MKDEQLLDQKTLRMINEANWKKDKERKIDNFRRLNAYVKKGQIVFTGSSLMEMFPINEFLMDFDIPLTIYNRGIGGFVCHELMDALDVCVFQLEPTRVFLNIGTNDLNDPLCDNEVLITRYEAIINKIIENLPGVELTLLAYYPVNPQAADTADMKAALAVRTNERLQSANEAVQAMSTRKGISFLNVNKNLFDADGNLKKEFTIEGMHMYPCGYEAVFKELLPYLNK